VRERGGEEAEEPRRGRVRMGGWEGGTRGVAGGGWVRGG